MGAGITLELRTLEMIQVLLQDNLEVNRQRLAVEKERLAVEKERLEIEKSSPLGQVLQTLFAQTLGVEQPAEGMPAEGMPETSHAKMMADADKPCDIPCKHAKINHLQGDGPCLMPDCGCSKFTATP